MKVVHIIKRIETIDEDIKDLRKLEKSLSKDKSFSTPIYISIEKQINILLDTRIKLLGLTVSNPPVDLVKEIEGQEAEEEKKPKTAKKPKAKKTKTQKEREETEEIDSIGIMTQDIIDEKFSRLKEEKEIQDKKSTRKMSTEDMEDEDDEEDMDDESIKLLDIALENGTLNKSVQDKEKKKVRFFKDNFPGGEY